MKFVDMFGGIGGFRLGLENVSDDFECVGYYDNDKYAVKSYNQIFEENHDPENVRQVRPEQVPEHELICGGFPCQSFSIAGDREGFEDTRGTLFYEIARIAKGKKPEMLLLENVKGLLSAKAVDENGESIEGTKGYVFSKILQTLYELGYFVEWQVLNSKFFGVPQNRERVFIIGHLGGEPGRKVFPVGGEDGRDSGEDGGERVPKIINHQMRPETRPSVSEEGQSGGSGILFNEEGYSYTLSKSPHYVSNVQPVITPDFKNKNMNKKDRIGSSDGSMFTIYGTTQHGVAYNIDENIRIRKLTPRECWRLQGFPDWAFERAEEVNSDTQLYKQAGNSVTVNVIEAIGKKIQKVKKEGKNDE